MSEYTKEPAFINRKQELEFLHDHIAKRPENILFIYGPKSSGKTTLLYKFVETIQKDNAQTYAVLYHNLRMVSISRYEDFLRTFFYVEEESLPAQTTTVGLSLGIFTINQETARQMVQHNIEPFKVMKNEFEKLQQQGIRPLIIIDELQALEGIYMEGQRELLKELFNFFVAMTKESHLCHVLIASSDGYFIERIYEDSKLKKTSSFFEVKYLDREDTRYWLHNLKKESALQEYVLTEPQIEQIWDVFGGSCWEVSDFLGKLQSGARNGAVPQTHFDEVLNKIKIMQRSKFVNYARAARRRKMFLAMHELLQTQVSILFAELLQKIEADYDDNTLSEELQTLVTKNILAFNPTTAEYALQGRSMEVGLEMYAQMVAAYQ